MQQVVVRKQGRLDYCGWSTRVLTLDPATGVLLLSKKGCADQIAYHAMQPTQIEIWPHYNSKFVEEDFDSLAAKLTLRLAGSAFPQQKASGRVRRATRVMNSAGMDTDEAWVLRFTSLIDMCSAVVALKRLTAQRSRETSDGSFGERVTKVDVGAVLPASAAEMLRPIQQAWIQDQKKKQAKRDTLHAL